MHFFLSFRPAAFKVATTQLSLGDHIVCVTVEIECASMKVVRNVRKDPHDFALLMEEADVVPSLDATKVHETSSFAQLMVVESVASLKDVTNPLSEVQVCVLRMAEAVAVLLRAVTSLHSRRQSTV